MALIKCPECGKEISDKALFCPGCGCPASEFSRCEVMEESGVCPFCGEKLVIDDGYCSSCGMKINLKNKEEKNCSKDRKNTFIQEPSDPYTVCPECNGYNATGTFTCIHCGHKYTLEEYKVVIPGELSGSYNEQTDNYRKGGLFTKIKCPNCWSIEFEVIDTKKKFSLGKAFVGNTVGGLVLGPAGAIAGTFQGVNGKSGKTKFVCLHCGKIWEQKI